MITNDSAMRQEVIDQLTRKHQADILVYLGEISRFGFQRVVAAIEERQRHARAPKQPNAILLLGTVGGDPHSAFRIARKLTRTYEKLTVMVFAPCKSAGTLICLGADEIIMSDNGELGPLDVQMRKDDEILRFGSGLDVMQTLNFLEQRAIDSFRSCLLDVHTGAGVSTKLAGELAHGLAVGLYSSILSQLDPVRLGEVHRSMNIASAYGSRLSGERGNVKPDAISRLITSYPSHSFVIDRDEAQELFNQVRAPDELEERVSTFYGPSDEVLEGPPFVMWLLPSSADEGAGSACATTSPDEEVFSENTAPTTAK